MAECLEPLVRTVPGKGKVRCTCVRECPAEAIRTLEGRAEVVTERCIACGNRVRVCTRGAEKARVNVSDVKNLPASGRRVAAVVAPGRSGGVSRNFFPQVRGNDERAEYEGFRYRNRNRPGKHEEAVRAVFHHQARGKGTGPGPVVTYGIVKMHRGVTAVSNPTR